MRATIIGTSPLITYDMAIPVFLYVNCKKPVLEAIVKESLDPVVLRVHEGYEELDFPLAIISDPFD